MPRRLARRAGTGGASASSDPPGAPALVLDDPPHAELVEPLAAAQRPRGFLRLGRRGRRVAERPLAPGLHRVVEVDVPLERLWEEHGTLEQSAGGAPRELGVDRVPLVGAE